jgi:hypothetical protein
MHVAVDDDSVYFVARCVGGPGPIYRVPKSGVTFPVDALNLSPRETVAHRGTQPVPVESDTATKSPCAFTERCEGNKRERCKQLPEGAYIDSFACRAPNAACVMSKGHAICVHDPPAACAPTVRRQDYCDGPNRVTCDQPEVGWAGPQWEMGRGCGHGPCATVAGQGTCPNF